MGSPLPQSEVAIKASHWSKAGLLRAAADRTGGLIDETYIFNTLQASAPAQELMQRFLDLGGQTPAGELRMEDLSAEVADG